MVRPFFGRMLENQLFGQKMRLPCESGKIIVAGEKKYLTSITYPCLLKGIKLDPPD